MHPGGQTFCTAGRQSSDTQSQQMNGSTVGVIVGLGVGVSVAIVPVTVGDGLGVGALATCTTSHGSHSGG